MMLWSAITAGVLQIIVEKRAFHCTAMLSIFDPAPVATTSIASPGKKIPHLDLRADNLLSVYWLPTNSSAEHASSSVKLQISWSD
uniref:Uncharacterized protein n=1 Tax=Physcomitrium patens TaxID=3218 RepID=A0A2K1IJ56_PHYPA|nr:hypothetical protein PHYPA_027996 [Physcomitrium patens]